MLRVNGALRPVDHPMLQADDTKRLVDEVLPDRLRQDFEQQGTIDFSLSLEGMARFRLNAFHQRGSISLAIRRVNFDPPSIADLELPDALTQIADARRGLIMVTGVTGSGKSTTLAAMLRHINETRREHVITVEDPIEYLYRDNKSIFNQLELGVDTPNFQTALKHVLRQDPDIILIGETRDHETIKTSLTSVETGHMVFSTLHTPDAKQTLNRILHFFPQSDERLILQQLSLSLKAVISQRLIPRCDIKGLIAAVEILVNTPIASKLIDEGRIEDLQQVMRNRESGMCIFDQSIVDLIKAGKIAVQTALKYCEDEDTLHRILKGSSASGDAMGIIG